MSSQPTYPEVLVRHFKNPANKGRLTRETLYETGYNSKCGDVIYLSIAISDDGHINEIMFDGRACMICLASASILTCQVHNKSSEQALNLIRDIENIFEKNNQTNTELHRDIKALSSIRKYPARTQCVTLAWQTLATAIQKDHSDS